MIAIKWQQMHLNLIAMTKKRRFFFDAVFPFQQLSTFVAPQSFSDAN